MSAVVERIHRDTYERHVARNRAYIEADGLCNHIGSVIEALETENNLLAADGDTFEQLPIYKNRDYAIQVLTAVQKALDLNYQEARLIDCVASLDRLITELEGVLA